MAQTKWVTPAGNFGTYAEGTPITKTFVATPGTLGNTLVYTILNGVFPDALVDFTLNSSTGVLAGTPGLVANTTIYPFTIRVFELLAGDVVSFADRTFSFSVEGITPPTFVTPSGPLYPGPTYLPDSTWNPFQILVNNPDPGTTAIIRLIGGSLPGGLEMNSSGLIRGYAEPSNINYNFTLLVESASGTNSRNFSIQIVEQTPATRAPAILNTRPPSYTIPPTDPGAPYYISSNGSMGIYSQDNYFIFRILGESFGAGSISYTRTGTLPPGLSDNVYYNDTNVAITVYAAGTGYAPGDQLKILGANLGGVTGVNDMTFTVATVDTGQIRTLTSIAGLNVDSNGYYGNVPVQTITGSGSGAKFHIGKINAGWITGTITNDPTLTVETYNFTYTAHNNDNGLSSTPTNFSMVVVSQTENVPFDIDVEWLSDSNLGTIYNGMISDLSVVARSVGGLSLEYTFDSGSLPPALTFNSDGTITGIVAFEINGSVAPQGSSFYYTFTVTAQNPTFPEVISTRTFTVTVYQQFDQPYDNLYIRSYFDISDRLLLNSLLQDQYIIPQEFLYRPFDQYFGKATDVVYQHMYGVPASNIETYVAAVEKNHYRRNLTLGPIKTAIAKDIGGRVRYEVVYSEIVDDLVNAQGISINKQISWPVPIHGSKRILYPDSLPNMREQIATFIGQDVQSSLLPLWMSGQQDNGGTIGFIPVWVICYTKPGYSEIVKNNIISPFPSNIPVIRTSVLDNTLEVESTVGFYPGMRVVFSGDGFGGVTPGVHYWVYTVISEKQFTITTSMYTQPITLSSATGTMYMTHIDWGHRLNELNFRVDRFEVGKAISYDYNPDTETWTTLPSGVDSTDSHDKFVFWQKNILGNS